MDTGQIEQVRRFNRFVTQRVGALESSYLRRGRPLGEARLIFETGAEGTTVRALRTSLSLDSGYLSRLLRSLETQRLLEVQEQTGDRRRRRVCLTAKGRQELAAYDKLSDDLAKSILAPLDPEQRGRLIRAMAEIEQLIRAPTVEVTLEPPDSKDARRCLNAYFQELAQRFDAGFDPAKSNPATFGDMTPPAGFFVVARLNGAPVGCGALKCRDDKTGEIKRMWTHRSARGQGIARKVLQTLEATARSAGLHTLRLETNRTLVEAQSLYRREGYEEVPAFNDEPYAHHWFEKRL